MLYITVPDMNDSVSSLTIADKEYLIRFTYNGTGDFWSFGLLDTNNNPIISPTKMVPKVRCIINSWMKRIRLQVV